MALRSQIVTLKKGRGEMLSAHKYLARKLEDMEKKYDLQFRVVFDAIRQLMMPPETKKRKIGFGREKEEE